MRVLMLSGVLFIVATEALAVQLTLKPAYGLKAQPISAVSSSRLAPPDGIEESPARSIVIGRIDSGYELVLPDVGPIPLPRPSRDLQNQNCPIVWR